MTTLDDRARQSADAPLRIAIVGGGFAGAVVAHQLARRAPGAFRISVVEPRPRLGSGVAYSTEDLAHRINVPASRMSALPSDPCHFDRWLRADGALKLDLEAELPDGRAFPTRGTFGRYVAETLEPYLMEGAIEHLQAKAVDVTHASGGWWVRLSDDRITQADVVVLAVTHPAPGAPRGLEALAGDPRYLADTQRPGCLDRIAGDARVTIVGTGLTMADIVASLDRRGHTGPIVAVSRRGLVSRGHAAVPGEFGAFVTPPSRSARALVARIRAAVEEAAACGRPWQHVIDAVRAQGCAIWAELPPGERARVVRRLRTFWDVHRFRVAPQVEASLARRRAEGTLRIVAATPVATEVRAGGLMMRVRLRGAAGFAEIESDAVALATGPAHGAMLATDPLLRPLAKQGLIGPDALGLGIDVDPASRAVGAGGRAMDTLFIAGPLARGTVGELMGLPEVARHAEGVAGAIIRVREGLRAPDAIDAA